MKYIDTHAHVFPDHIVEKVIGSLQDFYGYTWQGKGIVSDLLDSMDEAGITRSVIFSAATKPEQVESIHDYIHSVLTAFPGKFIGFGSMHPAYRNVKDELKRMGELGLKGLKFHPDFQQFQIDQKEMSAIYEAVGPDMPILFHVGDKRFQNSNPKRLAKVLDSFHGGLTVIAAHMGGFSEWESAWECIIGRRDVYVDVSSTIGHISAEETAKMVRAHGADRVLFASDYPAVRQKQAVADVLSMNLSNEENELIFYKNAERLFGETF